MYRSIPDLEGALELAEQMPDHPATESLRWMAEMQRLVSKRPERFIKMAVPAEKKLLEEMLERSFGVVRKKPFRENLRQPRSPNNSNCGCSGGFGAQNGPAE